MSHPAQKVLLAAAAMLMISTLGGPAGATSVAPARTHAVTCSTTQMDHLRALQGQLDQLAVNRQAGQAQYWYIDPGQCKVSIAVLRGAGDAFTREFVTIAGDSPDLTAIAEVDHAVSSWVARVPAPTSTPEGRAAGTFHGGSPILSGTGGSVYECTGGFNDYRAGTVTTAGHCAAAASTWYDATGNLLGTVSDHKFPGSDWTVITPAPGWTLADDVVNGTGGTTPITGFAQPQPGQSVCGTGATSGVQCGTIIATNVTVNYPEGAVLGLAESSQTGNGGDSGGPVYAKTTGVGLISGGPAGGGSPTFVQPLNF
ncbi:S1 family peptidase [Streptomyces blastmyceticus]|uniref:Streptogrisin C n=1 Tax=Streptomyces blastmyceticus TaxID=68180 RepID=A0ABP3GLA9_9ACTN